MRGAKSNGRRYSFSQMVRKGFSEKVVFEQRPEEGEEEAMWHLGGKLQTDRRVGKSLGWQPVGGA